MPMLSSGYRNWTSEAALRHERIRRAEVARLNAMEREQIADVYDRNYRNLTATALELGIRTATLAEKLAKHGIG